MTQARPIRVLVVDDEPTILALVGEVLGAAGYELGLAGTADEAMALHTADPFQIAVVDKNLPGTSGYTLIDLLRGAQPDLEALVITAYVSAGAVIDAIRLGVRRFIPKPFDVDDLARAVDASAAVWRLRWEVESARRLEAQAERLASLGQVVASVGHEIANPLAFVKANTTAMHEITSGLRSAVKVATSALEAGDVTAALEHLTHMDGDLGEVIAALVDSMDGIDRVELIATDLRRLGRVDDEAQTIDLVSVVQSTLRITRSKIQNRAQLIVRLDPVPTVVGSSGRIGQVLLNLLVNAAQAIEPGHRDVNSIEVSTFLDGDQAGIAVRDTGSGIPEDVLDQVFDPFFTTKGVEEGTGLGLSICREIMRGFGGRIDVESTVGKGTCFSIRLPVGGVAAEGQRLDGRGRAGPMRGAGGR